MRRELPMVGVRVVTPKEALELGLTGGFLRTVANSLERIGRSPPVSHDLTYEYNRRGDTRTDTLTELTNFDPNQNLRVAYELRKVARVVDRAKEMI